MVNERNSCLAHWLATNYREKNEGSRPFRSKRKHELASRIKRCTVLGEKD
jgi:hypothetical protein